MINPKEIEKYATTISLERLESYIKDNAVSVESVIDKYADNIKMSQAFYPELCVLEVTLRNSIDFMLRKYISETWIEDEIKNNFLLDDYDHNTIVKAYNDTLKECKSNSKVFTVGKVIANLNFGFWTNICCKKYSISIWHKKDCYRSVFVNYPNKKQEIGKISTKLYLIRRLRNRVFHYEQIFKYPKNTLRLFNEIKEFLSYLPDNGNSDILAKTSIFMDTYNKLTRNFSEN